MSNMTSVFRLHDSAFDFLETLQRSRNPRNVMLKALEVTGAPSPSIDLDRACAVLVVAEVVAALRGAQAEDAPQRILLGSIAKQRKSLTDVRDAAIKAVKALSMRENELWDSANKEEIESMAGDLIARLNRPPDFERVDAILASKPPRPRAGDVFRFPLGNGKGAFGRMVRDGYFYIYSGLFDEGAGPPLGSRDYVLYSTGLHEMIGSPQCPIVGRDPLNSSECAKPLVHNGPGPRTTLWGLSEYPAGKTVTPFQCIGVEQLGGEAANDLRARILRGETSLAKSLTVFESFLSRSDIERGIRALDGRLVRLFDEAENKRFNLRA